MVPRSFRCRFSNAFLCHKSPPEKGMIYGSQMQKRKAKRELCFTQSTHLVLRLKPNLPPLFAPRDFSLRDKIFRCADKYGVRIYNLVFNHTHLHSVVLLPNRKKYASFIRELTAMITHHFTQCANIPGLIFRKIFSNRPFLRATPWGKAYRALQRYMTKNERESGVTQYDFNILARSKQFWRKTTCPAQENLFEIQI